MSKRSGPRDQRATLIRHLMHEEGISHNDHVVITRHHD